ncbi:MAG: hypothetical protein GY757_11480 [bacterium]|nr:hypothetical protein [bacterium]
MLQLNPSFDEKDYDDCSSFTQYIDKARMFTNLHDRFDDKNTSDAQTSDSKDPVILFPESLLIKIYNEVIRRYDRPVTIQKYEKILFGAHKDISLKLYGISNVKQLMSQFKEKGLLKINKSAIEINPDTRFELTLKQLKLYHKPEVRKIVLSKIITLIKNWDVDNRDLTINALKKSILDESEAALSRRDFSGIINILKAGGAFLSPDNEPVSSLNIPMHLCSYQLHYLEDRILATSLHKLINAAGIADNNEELGALAGLLLGRKEENRIQDIKKLLVKLEKEKLIANKNNSWVKSWK